MAEMTKQELARKKREQKIREQKEAKAKAEAAAKAQKSDKADEPRRDWSTDLGGLIRKSAGGLAEGVDKVTDVLVDKEAWSDIAHGRADKRDWANAALDATMLIPGAGVAGAAARIGAKGLLRAGAREAAQAAAPKLTGLAAQVAERKAAAGGARILGRDTAVAAGKHRGVSGAGSVAGTVGKHSTKAGESSAAGRLLNEGVGVTKEGLESVATRRTRALAGDKTARLGFGNGTRAGFNQGRRRVLTNAALAGGANLVGAAYNAATNGGPGAGPGESAPGAEGIQTVGGVSGAATGYYLVNAAGETQSLPDSAAKALAAAYKNMGGSPDGSQVIYMGR